MENISYYNLNNRDMLREVIINRKQRFEYMVKDNIYYQGYRERIEINMISG